MYFKNCAWLLKKITWSQRLCNWSVAKLECFKEESIEVQVSNSFIGIGLSACADLTLNLMDFIHIPLWSKGCCSITFKSSQPLIIYWIRHYILSLAIAETCITTNFLNSQSCASNSICFMQLEKSRMAKAGRDCWRLFGPMSLLRQGHLQPAIQDWCLVNVSKDGDPTTILGNLCQCLVTLPEKSVSSC